MASSIMRAALVGAGVMALGIFSAFGYAPKTDPQDAAKGSGANSGEKMLRLACRDNRCVRNPKSVAGVRG